MASKNGLFNAALTELGHTTVTDTGENVESARVLLTVYDDVVAECLAAEPWNFAAKNAYPTGDTGLITPTTVGYNYGYTKPTDWVRTIMVSDDPYLVFELPAYFDGYYQGAGIWAADTGEIFVRYVSDTGAPLTTWPAYFTRYVALSLAARVSGRLTQDQEQRKTILALRDMAKRDATQQNKADSPSVRFAPSTSWQGLYQAIATDLGDPDMLTKRSGEVRRVIDDVIANVRNDCLGKYDWNFATRTTTFTLTTSDTGVRAGGYAYGVGKPSDWVRTVLVSDDAYGVFELPEYFEGNNYWSADTGELIVRYVANDTGTGLNISDWPSNFRRYIELETAVRIFPRVASGDDDIMDALGGEVSPADKLTVKTARAEQRVKLYESLIARRDAVVAAAVEQDMQSAPAPHFAPTGSWTALYQESLSELGDVTLLTTRSGEARRAIDDVYSQVLGEVLEAGSWNFAMETIKATADTGVTPNFGFPEVFAKPSDWVRTIGISSDEYFTSPLLNYYDDANFWSADSNPIYVRYVSNDTGLGLEQSRWPDTFKHYVELELASRVCMRLTKDPNLKEQIDFKRDKAKRTALNKDALNEPNPKFPPMGSWNQARGGRTGRDRGSRSNLTG